MGLLDDAIREHLELKRRRGADPSEVAREEQDALAPVFADEEPGSDGDGDLDGSLAEGDDDDGAPDEDAAADVSVAPSAHAELPSYVGQETAELDMQAIMEEDPEAADAGSPEAPGAVSAEVAPPPDSDQGLEDSLEWEMPGDGDGDADTAGGDVPGQERLSFE
jgi:hypothetical protein